MNGFTDSNKLVYLQVKGKNQLFKEIEESQLSHDKRFDMRALHRNEMTGEEERYCGNTSQNRQRARNNAEDAQQDAQVNEMILSNYDKKQFYC